MSEHLKKEFQKTLMLILNNFINKNIVLSDKGDIYSKINNSFSSEDDYLDKVVFGISECEKLMATQDKSIHYSNLYYLRNISEYIPDCCVIFLNDDLEGFTKSYGKYFIILKSVNEYNNKEIRINGWIGNNLSNESDGDGNLDKNDIIMLLTSFKKITEATGQIDLLIKALDKWFEIPLKKKN